MINISESTNANLLGLALRFPTSKLILEILSNMGISLRNSLHDNYEEHQVVDVSHFHLELYTHQTINSLPTLILETDNLANSLSVLPDGFKVIYKGSTDLDNYSVVALCKYSTGLEVKIYERRV
ncbi:MAG: hypothetical protein F6K50_09390 [Moorea sp. SIO3I7]|uniref:hypothetical protein n=1 Tax=unclassified Moorena TaxID=2683338 RepID=UPI0013C0A410|nr:MULTISPECIES: hypothetical protein [unclassified Moorena]NEN95735.1 hypothetical protein [Moorena sp. SIO3I7]NEO09565.1 hypothetical protein [Moorena sp. SIO3I8]NEO62518.1 hypothetical protein [Moorena sp. SIO4G2]NEP25431.1 hypothetical protein [Moorena sp. SIO3I6]